MANIISLLDGTDSEEDHNPDLEVFASWQSSEYSAKVKECMSQSARRRTDPQSHLDKCVTNKETGASIRASSIGSSERVESELGSQENIVGEVCTGEDFLNDDCGEELTQKGREELWKKSGDRMTAELRGHGGEKRRKEGQAVERGEKKKQKEEAKREREEEKRREKEEKGRERKEKKRIKEEELAAKRSERVRAALSRYRERGGEYRREISIVVSGDFLQTHMGERVVCRLEDLFPGQITFDCAAISRSIYWKGVQLEDGDGNVNGQGCNHIVLCFTAEDFVKQVQMKSLESYMHDVLRAHPDRQIEFVTVGIERFVKRTANKKSSIGSDSKIIGERAVSDCCSYIYFEYGVRTRHIQTVDELAEYICQITDAIAFHPYRRLKGFLCANMSSNSRCAGDRSEGVVTNSATPARLIGETVVERPWDLAVVYMNVLCRIPGVSLEFAKAIRARYPTLSSLLQAYDGLSTEREKAELLSDIQLNQRRRVGPSVSKKIYLVFTSRDPNLSFENC